MPGGGGDYDPPPAAALTGGTRLVVEGLHALVHVRLPGLGMRNGVPACLDARHVD